MSLTPPIHLEKRQLYPLVLVAIITGLAVWGLGRESLSLDEGVTAIRVQDPWREFWLAVTEWEPNFALYYLLMRAWTAVAGTSEVALRVPSVLFVVAAGPFVYLCVRRLFGPRAALGALLFYGLNPFVIRQAQDARPYSLVLLLVSAGAYLFIVMIQSADRRVWLGWTAVSCLALYAHPFTALSTGAQIVTLIMLKRRALSPARLAVSSAAIVLAGIPLAMALLPSGAERISWIPEADPEQVGTAAAVVSGGTIPWLLIYVVAGAGMLWLMLRERERGPERVWPYAFILGWVALPIVALYVLSHLYTPVFLDRYLLIVLPGLAATAGVTLARLRPPWLAAVAVAIVVAVTVPPLAEIYAARTKPDWRGAAGAIADDARPGDAVIIFRRGVDPFSHYYRRYDAPSVELIDVGTIGDPRRYPRLLDDFDRVWLVINDQDATSAERLTRPLRAWDERDTVRLDHLRVRLLEAP